MKGEFTPKLWTMLRTGELNASRLGKDIIAGITVGIVALPLAIAFAIASGVEPGQGLITAVVAGFIISALGGSRVQIGGPTGAFVVIVSGILAEFGLAGLALATLMAGFILVIFGLLKLGNYLRFIPHPLIVGFTSGIALLIFLTQINDLLGLGIRDLPSEFLPKMAAYGRNLANLQPASLAVGAVTMLIIAGLPRIFPKLPPSIFALLIVSIGVRLLGIAVETIGDRFGDFQLEWGPRFSLAEITPAAAFRLIQPALAIALLGAIESLLSAVVADGMTGSRHRPNMELIAQGLANMGSALTGGIPATGAIARTVTNIRSGGRSPVAGIIHALTLLAIALFLGPLVRYIPMSALAGIMILVAYRMSEWRQFVALLRSHPVDILILLSTFVLTVVADLVIAIQTGLVLSSMLFMKRMGDSLRVDRVEGGIDGEEGAEELLDARTLPEDLLVYEIYGPLFFGAAEEFEEQIAMDPRHPGRILLRLRYVPILDATAVHRLKEMLKNFNARHIQVYLSGVSPAMHAGLERQGLLDLIPREHIFEQYSRAMEHLTAQ